MQGDGHQALERDEIAVEMAAEVERVAQTRQFEDLFRLSQGARRSAFAP
jgi:hypothetical protein